MVPQNHSSAIRAFILRNVSDHPEDITMLVTKEFGISRQASHRHLVGLIKEGILESTGSATRKRYKIKPRVQEGFRFQISTDLEEHIVWRERISQYLQDISPNILRICQYGFTEMFNNAVEHSNGTEIIVWFTYYPDKIEMQVVDNGIGIFRKLQQEMNLEDERHAILELSKGKLTTDAERHSGEGIFFTSRVFDEFCIFSGELFFAHSIGIEDDWLIEDTKSREGTRIIMTIGTHSVRDLTAIMDKYASAGDDYGFRKTHVPVSLARYGNENLVSRSQAKRLLLRFDKFREVFLDFKGVNSIGQPFADEIFRVFASQNANIKLIRVNANEEVENMIKHALASLAPS